MVFRRRPPRSTVVFLVAAVACATGAFSLMRGYATRLEALRPAVGPPVPVVVTTGTVERGETLTIDDLAVVDLPTATAPVGALHEPTPAIGRTTLTAFAEGEAVSLSRLVGGSGGELAALVPPGLRAVPIVVPTVPEGLVVGDRIDVFATYGEGRMYAETVGSELELIVAPTEGSDASSAVGGSAGGAQLVVLADTATATRLARSSVASVLSIAVVGTDDS